MEEVVWKTIGEPHRFAFADDVDMSKAVEDVDPEWRGSDDNSYTKRAKRSLMTGVSPNLLVGAAAAIFAFLSVLVGLLQWRWGALDSELERERKVNRLVPMETLTKSYEEEELMPDGVDEPGTLGSLASRWDTLSPLEHRERNPDYTFSLDGITVRCNEGLQRLWRGLEGETKLEIGVEKGAFPTTEPGFPPDIDALEEFDSTVTDVTLEAEDEGVLVVRVDSVDEDKVLQVVEELFQFIDENLAQEKLPYGWNRNDA